jgi:Flp pilus assembly protein TadD
MPPLGRPNDGAARFGWIVALALAGVVVVGGWQLARVAWWGDERDGERPRANVVLQAPAPPRDDYVGSQACAECHAEIADSFAAHPMGQSMHAAGEAPRVEDYEEAVFATGDGRTYRVELEDEGMRHYEAAADRQGVELYDQGLLVDYVIGSGHRGRSYVLDRDGWLFQSPIAWYSQEGRWGLSPGYDPASHPRFERELTDRCLQCHAGRMNPVERSTADIQQYQRPAVLEHAIGCERCHGPGKEHVERWRDPEAWQSDSREDPIVNPVRLEPSRRESVCYQCHLQGVAQFLRYGRAHGDFRPGDHVGDIWTTFVAGPGVELSGETVAVSQVEQLHASRCFEASAGRMGCISCHDPHRLPAKDERLVYFRQRCLECHQQQGCSLPEPERQAQQDSCIACHMPRLSALDIPHTVQTDHRILRVPREPDGSAGSASESELAIFDDAAYELPEVERRRAEGLLAAKQAERQQDAQLGHAADGLLESLIESVSDDLAVLDALAMAALVQGDGTRAAENWRRILEIDPRHQEALQSLALQHESRREFPQASEYLERLIEVNPWRGDWHFRRAIAEAHLGRLDQAIAAARTAVELDPSAAHFHLMLADLLHAWGERDEADRHRELGRKLRRPVPAR